MNNFERAKFDYNPGYGAERFESGMENKIENSVDMRPESELFQDHERIDNNKDVDELAKLRDTLAEDSDGVLHLDIPEYAYDFASNPFVGMGPRVHRTYAISRYLDVVFLHRFMYHDILVCGLRSREFVEDFKRAELVKHIKNTGGVPVKLEGEQPYDFLASKFAPFVASDSTAAWLALYHKQQPLSEERPHYPVDVWVIYDAGAYEEISGYGDFRRAYKLKNGYDRQTSVLGIAQIN